MEEWWRNIPYKIIYILLGLTIIVFFFKGMGKANIESEKEMKLKEKEAEECIIRYEQLGCSLSNLTEECRLKMECMRKQVVK